MLLETSIRVSFAPWVANAQYPNIRRVYKSVDGRALNPKIVDLAPLK